MKLTGSQVKQLRKALQSAFPSKSSLKRMVRENLEEYLDELGDGNLRDLISDLLAWAESNNRTKELVICSVRENYRNQLLQDFCEKNIDDLLEFDDSTFPKMTFNQLFSTLRIIDFEILWKIGKALLPPTIERDRPESIQELEGAESSHWFRCFLLLQMLLEDFPLFEQQPSILVFVSHLSKEFSLNEADKKNIVEWLNNAVPNFNSRTDEFALPSASSTIRGGLQAYLMIMVNPEKSKKLRVTAILWCIAPTGKNRKIPVHLNPESNERGILTTATKLPQVVSQFVHHSILTELVHPENLMGCDYYTLTIELFLPIRYLCEPIDRWKIKYDSNNQFFLGSKFPLVVRSYDRVIKPELKNAFAAAWYWRKDWLEKNPEPTMLNERICHLTEINCVRLGTLRETLREKIGIKITCPLPESETEMLKFLQAMLESGVPMGTWSRRRENLTSDSEHEINQFWCSNLILNQGDFLERVRRVRAVALDDQDSPEQYWGGHFTVLWDDWERMPVLEPLHKGG